jgi:hypothetical protein
MTTRGRGRPKGSKNKQKEPIVKIRVPTTMSARPEREGLYTSKSENSFESTQDIQLRKMGEGNVSIGYPDRYITELSFEELNEEMIRRSGLRQKVENKEYNTTIEIQTGKPIGLVWWADQHVGGQFVDYARLKWEADEIKANPYLRIALGGDFSDSFVWLPAAFDDVANLNEQNLYLYKLMEYVGWDKILFCVLGNHPKWSRKTGLDGYDEMRKKIPVFDGIGTVDLIINEVTYTGAAIHKARGSSYLDPNFGGKRFLRENDGYDFVLTAHTHDGGAQTINRKDSKGEREVALLSGKTFKETDDFMDTEGFKRKTGIGLGSNGIIFNHQKKSMLPVSSFSKMLDYIG